MILNNNIGNLFRKQKKTNEAIPYLEKALELATKMKITGNQMSALYNLGLLYKETGNYKKAVEYCNQSLVIAQQLNSLRELSDIYNVLSETSALMGQSEAAYSFLKKHNQYNDSVINEQSAIEAEKMEAKYLNQVKELEIENLKKSEELKDAQLLKKEEQEKTKNIVLVAVAAGLALMLFITMVILKNSRQRKKDNEIISAQKKEVESQRTILEEKNKEIMDSITYAKRLQEAILPPLSSIKENLANSFLLYKPKDIIAGDFYWMEVVSGEPSNCILLAAADCTGHGVPGALVSVVCSNALNRSVKEFGLTDPGQILDKTRELVLDTFSKSETAVKDGMDISLVKIEVIETSKKLPKGKLVIPAGSNFAEVSEGLKKFRIQWAGANNPLWYIKDGVLSEVRAHKQPIGKTDVATPFPSHNFELSKGDSLYLFTDGYADQFGGPKGKKYKYKPLEELILSLNPLSLQEQEQQLSNNFEDWKGNLEQVDDVCIIGIRL